MSGHELHPVLNVMAMAAFNFQYIFWVYYAPAVVVIWLMRFVAKRITKRIDRLKVHRTFVHRSIHGQAEVQPTHRRVGATNNVWYTSGRSPCGFGC
jgi:hypothetical protein